MMLPQRLLTGLIGAARMRSSGKRTGLCSRLLTATERTDSRETPAGGQAKHTLSVCLSSKKKDCREQNF